MNCERCGAVVPGVETTCPACGATRHRGEGEGLAPGTELAGKYKILEEIGAGGMGRVYRAIQRPLDLEVCIKTLHQGASADPAFPARFEREARTTSRLRHPNIVQIIDFGTHLDGTMYLVMEFIRGQSLANIAKRNRPIPEERAVRILSQVCDALATAHAVNVLHRDLKPANIMVQDLADQPDHVKVLDFGSALILEGSGEAQRLTQVGTVIGTPAYMAPEHILGKGLDARVDVYAVGVLLYRLLCGDTPFRGSTQSVLAQHVTVKPDPPSRRNPEARISPQMEQVVMRALVKDPAHRFPNAIALKEAMERALRGDFVDELAGPDDAREPSSIEVASTERSVIVISIRGAYRMDAEVTTRVVNVGQSYGAHVETAGETVYLIFGFDREGPDVTAAAVRCGLELARQDAHRPVRVGIHDAKASCHGRFGAPGFRFELYGEGQSRASALAAAASNRRVLVAGPVARHVPPDHRLVPVRPPADFAVPVFAVEDDRVAPPRPPFVGRDAEKRALVQAALESEGGTLIIVGPEGAGKSRLVDEVATAVGRLDVRWIVVRATSRAVAGPEHPVSQLAALGWNTERGLDAVTERHAVPLMTGRPVEEDALRGERRQMRALSVAVAGLSSRARQERVALVLDDVHLADGLTTALARRLHEVAGTLGFLLVLCVRSERSLPFALGDGCPRTKLGPLSRGEATALVRSRLRADPDLKTLERAVAATVGHPLLGEEVARAINDGYEVLLERIDGKPPLEALDRLLAHRIERLSQPARRIAKAAAVLGLEPRQAELAELGEAYEDLAALMELESRAVLMRGAEGRLRFPFARLRQVTLAATPAKELERLHRRAAAVLSASADSAARGLELGEHLLLSGQSKEAFEVLREAAARERYEGKNRRAILALRRAMDAGRRLDARHAVARVEVARDLGELLIQTGDIKRAEELLRQASSDSRSAGDAALAAEPLRLHARAVTLLGNPARGLEELEGCLRFADQRKDEALALRACVDLIDAAEKKGDAERAAEILDRASAIMAALSPDDSHAAARIQLSNRIGRRELERGRHTRAIVTFAEALDLAERTGDHYQAAGLLGNLGGAYAREGDMAKAVHFTERALRASEDLGDDLGVSRQSFNLALLRLNTGQLDAAKELLRNSEAAAARAGWAEGLAMSRAATAKLAGS